MKDLTTTSTWTDSFSNLVKLEESLPSHPALPRGSPMPATPTSSVDARSAVSSLGCEIHCRSSQSLAVLRSLSPDEIIVLFTPVLPADVNVGGLADDQLDPFEPFGKALSQYHKRIRHVPFVDQIGLTHTHVAFLRHAGAIITVMCKPRGSSMARNTTSLKNQARFARESMATLQKMHAKADQIPGAMVAIGLDGLQSLPEYQTMIRGKSCDEDNFQQMANLLLRPVT